MYFWFIYKRCTDTSKGRLVMAKETVFQEMDRIAYNQFNDYDEIPYQVINHLMDNNELIWKLLKHDTPDAYLQVDLTKEEKARLVYNGEEVTTNYRVFMDVGQPDAVTKEMTLLRISHWHITPKNRTTGIITLSFQVYAHYKINHLSNYKTRNDVIINELIKTMNGVQIKGGLGVLYFDGKRELTDRMIVTGQIPFIGKQLFMSMNYG
jgi:hypothetical protein